MVHMENLKVNYNYRVVQFEIDGFVTKNILNVHMPAYEYVSAKISTYLHALLLVI